MARRHSDYPVWPIVFLPVLLILVSTMLFMGGKDEKAAQDNSLTPGIDYLESLERKDPQQVIQTRKDMYQAKLDAQRDQLVADLNSGSTDPFSLFKDYVVMGDSRAVGFWYHKFLDKSRCFCDGGHTIRKLEEYMDQVVALNPSAVYLTYGLNDCSSGYWDSIDVWVTEYMHLVQEMKPRLPDAPINVSSIPQVNDDAYKKSTRWKALDQWNEALEKACRDNGVTFADCQQILIDHPNYLDPVDGHHFRKEFYRYWASCLVAAMLMEDAQ